MAHEGTRMRHESYAFHLKRAGGFPQPFAASHPRPRGSSESLKEESKKETSRLSSAFIRVPLRVHSWAVLFIPHVSSSAIGLQSSFATGKGWPLLS